MFDGGICSALGWTGFDSNYGIKNMKYSEKITVSWHDTDARRAVRPGKTVEYMQEIANHQCEHSGLPLEALRDEKGLAFILGAISLKFLKPLRAYDEIEVRTWCKEAKSYIFNRYFDILRDGEVVAEASSTWVLIDLNTKSMVRADSCPFFDGRFYYDESIPPASLLPKARIARDAELFEVAKRKIVYSDIDYNMHMNNTRYPDMICDCLEEMNREEESFFVSEMSLTFVKESRLGATLTVSRSQADESGLVSVRTVNENGDACLEALVRLKRAD